MFFLKMKYAEKIKLEEAMKKISMALFTIMFAFSVNADMKDSVRVNGVLEAERMLYTVHYTDGTAQIVAGPIKFEGGDLAADFQNQIIGFFKEKAAELKKDLKMSPKVGERAIEAITPTEFDFSLMSISVGDSNYMRISPVSLKHNAADKAKKQKVETLFSFKETAKKAAKKTASAAKKTAKKTVETVKKATPHVISGVNKAVDIGKVIVPMVVAAAPIVLSAIPEMKSSSATYSNMGVEMGKKVGGMIGGNDIAGAILGGAAGAIGGVVPPLIKVGKNLKPIVYGEKPKAENSNVKAIEAAAAAA